MKKTLLLFSLLPVLANAQTVDEKLVGIQSSDDLEFYQFEYTDFFKIQTQSYKDIYNGMLCMDFHTYNEKNQLVSILTRQDLDHSYDPDNLTDACRVDYQYDEQGNLVIRDNFNRDFSTGELTQSARIVYTYDEDGGCTTEEQFWMFDLEKPFLRLVKTYDEQGRLQKVEELQQDWYDKDTYYFSGRQTFTYDEEGRLVHSEYGSATGEIDETTGEYLTELINGENLNYNAAGDVESHEVLTKSGSVSTREVYTYDENVNAENVAYPVTPEFPVAQQQHSLHKVLSEEHWVTDMNSGDLVYTHTMNFSYEPTESAVKALKYDSLLGVNYNPATSELVFNGNVEGAAVRLVSISGQTLLTDCVKGNISTADFTPGAYIVILTKAGQSPVSYKFLVK